MPTVYEAAGGTAGLIRLAAAWHERVLADEVVSHAFSHGYHPDHTERLAAYWAEALGGPPDYSANYGSETTVVRMHSGNGPHEEMDRRAIACFDQALTDCGLTEDPLRQVLHDYFAWATTTTMAQYHHSAADVPADLTIPRWSWEGQVGAAHHLLLAAIVEMVPGREEAGQRYEDAVLDLLARHGGTLERRTRSTDGTAEMHLIHFRERAGLETFMADPDRAALRAEAGDAAPTTRVIEVRDVP